MFCAKILSRFKIKQIFQSLKTFLIVYYLPMFYLDKE